MSIEKRYASLPQMTGGLFLTDGGLETTLIFHDEIHLPCFAAFDLMKDQAGMAVLRRYYAQYAEMAANQGTGFILETPTWRASADWGDRLGYSETALDMANRESVDLMKSIRHRYQTSTSPMVISGNIGPRGDGYVPGELMTVEEAEAYHATQVRSFKAAGVDLVSALTINYANEAVGIVRAAVSEGLPVVMGLTVETDGRLPTGQALRDAIEEIDSATDGAAAYFMINCAHPDHFDHALPAAESWVERIRGIRANASRCSHAELDEAEELDDGNPGELGDQYRKLLDRLPWINVLGGCCGTDHRHVREIAFACRPLADKAA